MNPAKAVRGRLALLCAALIWGIGFVVMKDTLNSVPVFTLLGLRFSIGLGMMSLLFYRHWRHVSRSCLIHGLILGGLEFAAYAVQTFGLTETTPGYNAFLTAVYCVLVPFVDWLIFRRRPLFRNWFAGLICICGIGLIALDRQLRIGRGDALSLLSGVLYAFQVTCLSVYAREDDPIQLTLITFAIVALGSWTFALAVESGQTYSLAGCWYQLAFLGIMATGVALLLQNVGQALTPAGQAGILLSMESVFGAAASVLLGYELLTVRKTLGFAAVFLAVLISEAVFAGKQEQPQERK